MKTKMTGLGLALLVLAAPLWIFQTAPQQSPGTEKSVAQLAQRLELESLRGVEFFNSSFDSQALSAPGAADSLKATITEPNRRFFLSLLALRKVRLDLYKQIDPRMRTGILVDALNQSIFFNGWGLPHRALEDSAKPLSEASQAISELDTSAKQWLGRLLLQNRSAPLWGSEPIANKYRYRVADYALVSLLLIDNRRITFPVQRADRDNLIGPYLEALNINTQTMH